MSLQQKRHLLRFVLKKDLSGDMENVYCAGDTEGRRPETGLLRQARQGAVKRASVVCVELMLQLQLLGLYLPPPALLLSLLQNSFPQRRAGQTGNYVVKATAHTTPD